MYINHYLQETTAEYIRGS